VKIDTVGSLIFYKELTIRGIVCLIYMAISPVSLASSIDAWTESLEAFKANQPQKACQTLKSWTSELSTKNIRTPEGMFNLALCSWQTNEPDKSVLYALESLKLRTSPTKKWSDLKLLRNLQKEIGVRDNLPSRLSFVFRLFSSFETSILLGIIGSWILIVYFTFHKRIKINLLIPCVSVSICWLLGLVIIIHQQMMGPLAVVSGDEEVPIFAFDKFGKSTELTRLPKGTLVELGTIKEGFSQIVSPLGGWIKTDFLQSDIIQN